MSSNRDYALTLERVYAHTGVIYCTALRIAARCGMDHHETAWYLGRLCALGRVISRRAVVRPVRISGRSSAYRVKEYRRAMNHGRRRSE